MWKIFRCLPALLLFGLFFGCAAPSLPPVLGTETVKVIRDLPYRQGKGADPVRHLLDIYLPTQGENWPVALILHGGAWIVNDKSVVGNMGYALANAGVATVCANYRLFPKATHPAQIEDLVSALAWTRGAMGKYGADADRLFLIGYSAGAPIAALAALDPKYLASVNLSPGDLRGVVVMSGIYDVSRIPMPLRLVFTEDRKVWQDASPINHVHSKAPPFLILHADRDIRISDENSVKAQSREFYLALKGVGVDVALQEIPNCNHDGIEEQIGRDPNSMTFRYLIGFIRNQLDSAKPE